MNTWEKRAFVEVCIWCHLFAEAVPGGIRVRPSDPKCLCQTEPHIGPVFSLQGFDNKLLNMHTTLLSTVIAVMVCESYVYKAVFERNTVYVTILIDSPCARVVSRSHYHVASTNGHFHSAVGQINDSIQGTAFSGKPLKPKGIIHVGDGFVVRI